jgi:hypothetical protein
VIGAGAHEDSDPGLHNACPPKIALRVRLLQQTSMLTRSTCCLKLPCGDETNSASGPTCVGGVVWPEGKETYCWRVGRLCRPKRLFHPDKCTEIEAMPLWLRARKHLIRRQCHSSGPWCTYQEVPTRWSQVITTAPEVALLLWKILPLDGFLM